MTDSEPALESAAELTARVRDGGLTAAETIQESLDRIDSRDEEINAFVTVIQDEAVEAAERADIRRKRDLDIGLLHGVPIALKDLRATKEDVRHTFGSTLFEEFVPPSSAAIVERLEAAGGVVVGKTNTPEFGHKGTTDNELVGATASPIDPSLNAGGSSGGSAAAVAAGMVPIATGSDAGGSIRIPAAACNVFGFKPSYGLVPFDTRPNAFGSKRHHVAFGPLSRTVQDAALALDVMAGYHPDDPSSVPVEIDPLSALGRSIEDFEIAYSPDLDVFPVSDAVQRVIEDALAGFEATDAVVEEIAVDHGFSLDELENAVLKTFSTEVLGNMEVLEEETGIDVREFPEQVSDSLLGMLDAGEQYSVAEVAATGTVRTAVFDAIEAVLDEYELLVLPTLGRADVGLHEEVGHEAWEMALTWPFNWTGHPVASVPAGLTEEGHPVGLQIVGPRYNDETVIAASASFERERPWHEHYPDRFV